MKMENNVFLDPQNNSIINGIILLTTTEDFYYELDEVTDELIKKFGEKFTIIVDHFITNGFSFNRFGRIDYTNGSRKYSMVNSREIDDEYDNLFKKYVKEHIDFLETSSLSKKAISIIKHEIIG